MALLEARWEGVGGSTSETTFSVQLSKAGHRQFKICLVQQEPAEVQSFYGQADWIDFGTTSIIT